MEPQKIVKRKRELQEMKEKYDRRALQRSEPKEHHKVEPQKIVKRKSELQEIKDNYELRALQQVKVKRKERRLEKRTEKKKTFRDFILPRPLARNTRSNTVHGVRKKESYSRSPSKSALAVPENKKGKHSVLSNRQVIERRKMIRRRRLHFFKLRPVRRVFSDEKEETDTDEVGVLS